MDWTTFNTTFKIYDEHARFCELIMYTKHVCVLQIVVDNEELLQLYKNHIDVYNNKLCSTLFPDAGFDIFVPEEQIFNGTISTKFIDMDITAQMFNIVRRDNANSANDFVSIKPTGYYICPRSSISKTPLMLANHVGIIDSGYRGSIIGAFRALDTDFDNNNYVVEKHTRLLQICHPSLCPIYVMLIRRDQLCSTERGINGFGSTGK